MNTRTRDTLERIARQLLQTAAPAIAVILTSPTRGDVKTTAVALASVAVFTILKAIAGLKADPGDPVWLALTDRAGSAFATLILGLGVTDVTGLLALDWGKALAAAAVAAATAVVAYFVAPPTIPPTPAEPAPTGYDATSTSGAPDNAPAGYDGDGAHL